MLRMKAKSTNYFKALLLNSTAIEASRWKCYSAGRVQVDKQNSAMDEQVNITVQRLKPGDRITLRATYEHPGRMQSTYYQSYAQYEAGINGCIDLTKSPSLNGTYKGVEPMGLFWSMIPLPNQSVNTTATRIVIKDPSVPLEIKLELYSGFLYFEGNSNPVRNSAEYEASKLDSLTLYRRYMVPNAVSEETVCHGRLQGSLFAPRSDGKLKGIIDLWGLAGGHMPSRAALLASYGFAVYALPYWNYKGVPRNIEIEYFDEAANWLLNHPKVDENGIGILATCFGGMLGFLLATRMKKKVKAITGINAVDFPGVVTVYVGGKPSRYVPIDMEKMPITERGHVTTRNLFDLCKERCKEEHEACRIPVENLSSKILLLVGEYDAVATSDIIGRRICERFRKQGKKDQCELVIYPKAGHLIELPYLPLCTHSYQKEYGRFAEWGGEPKPHARAQEDAWCRVINFFKKNL